MAIRGRALQPPAHFPSCSAILLVITPVNHSIEFSSVVAGLDTIRRISTVMATGTPSSRCQRDVRTKKSSADRRRRSTAASFLTAAALHLAIPCSTTGTVNAFVPPSGRTASTSTCVGRVGSVGPLHASLSSSATPLCTSASSLLDVTREPLRTSNLHSPLASTVDPSTAFLSSHPAPISIPGTISKYGGRASGSSSAPVFDEEKNGGAANSDLLVTRGNSLGFVIVDDRIGASRTSLSVSRSTSGPSSHQQQIDASSFDSGLSSSGSKRRSDKNAEERGGEIGTIDSDSSPTSPVTRRVAASLLRNSVSSGGRSSATSGAVGKDNERASSASVVPAWFPWIPTRSQIETLKMSELREACVERGLNKVRKREFIGRLQYVYISI